MYAPPFYPYFTSNFALMLRIPPLFFKFLYQGSQGQNLLSISIDYNVLKINVLGFRFKSQIKYLVGIEVKTKDQN